MSEILQVTPKDLAKWLKSGAVVLVDVREAAEYRSQHIKDAKNLPLSQVTIDNEHMPEHDHKRLVLHCQSGRRSMMACEKLISEKVPYDIWNLEGGMNAWKQAGLDIIASGRKLLPMEQQVHLTIGLMVIVGMLLGSLVSYWWFLLPVIAGLGLINSGLTGWCGLMKLMAKMPWNRK